MPKTTLTMQYLLDHMWCDQAKWVWSRKFLFSVFCHFLLGYYLSFNLMKTPWRLGNWFLRNSIFGDCKNNKKQRNYLLCLAISLNEYLRVPTHFAWLHHICWGWNFTLVPVLHTFTLVPVLHTSQLGFAMLLCLSPFFWFVHSVLNIECGCHPTLITKEHIISWGYFPDLSKQPLWRTTKHDLCLSNHINDKVK